jgi:hypothetical protein
MIFFIASNTKNTKEGSLIEKFVIKRNTLS